MKIDGGKKISDLTVEELFELIKQAMEDALGTTNSNKNKTQNTILTDALNKRKS